MISDEEVCKVNNDECVIGAFYIIDYNLWGISMLIWNLTVIISKIFLFVF